MAIDKKTSSFMEIFWTDPVTEAKGYVVIDTRLRGIASGGLRMRAGCTVEEVRGLAEAMTKKEAIHLKPGMRYIPVGGAKGGIDFSPQSPEALEVLERFILDLYPIIQQYWGIGEDLGVQSERLEEILTRHGLGGIMQAADPLIEDPEAAKVRQEVAFSTQVDGVLQSELVGGLGVAQSALTTLDAQGYDRTSVRAVIQGFGSMGGATAKYLAKAGVKVVGVIDVEGVIYDENGLDVEALFAARDRLGNVDRSKLPAGATERPAAEWLSLDCDLLVPAAISNCITVENQAQIRARIIVEAANLPVTIEAEAALAARGVTVIPDFVANSGTNAWWWWVTFGDVNGRWEESEQMVRSRLSELTTEIITASELKGITPREAGLELVDDRLQQLSTAD